MIGLTAALLKREEEGRPIALGIIGAGQMGRGLVCQTVWMKGITPRIVADRHPQRAMGVLLAAGIPREEIRLAATPSQAEDWLAQGKYVATDLAQAVTGCSQIDVVIDATGNTEAGARLAVDAIAAHRHIISLNVETDVVVGPLLHRMAQREGVIYTGSAGDEPGAVMELYDFARALGFQVLALGKGKNNPVNRECTPDMVEEEAARKRMSPRMLTSFKDASKTMVELAAISNATGFLPACPGGTGHPATPDQLASVYRLKEEGGILDRYQVVDYVNGVAPGVYCIITSPLEEVHREVQYLLLGEGPNYALYRPYHLASLETPVSAARVVLQGEPSIVPAPGAPYSEVVTVAKRDLRPGEYLDGIGGYTAYGSLWSYREAQAAGALPLGLVNDRTRVKVPIPKGATITYSMVDLDPQSFLLRLRREQEQLAAQGRL